MSFVYLLLSVCRAFFIGVFRYFFISLFVRYVFSYLVVRLCLPFVISFFSSLCRCVLFYRVFCFAMSFFISLVRSFGISCFIALPSLVLSVVVHPFVMSLFLDGLIALVLLGRCYFCT